ncbi:hypothetical protein AVEN_78180-1 [Araneus ventricosus]|uniref:Uncharacterized protein n=1 Tax=Araneus ventricosus TaxID=182803 RepID=A0A4Y2DR31_ARAVE|nr:hypothetical protein AVEN_78180-1 [Araneus ventricosus]
MREQTNWQKSQRNMGYPIHLLSFLNRTQKASSGRACLRSGEPHGRMAIQATKSGMLEEWQTSWKNGDTGIKIPNVMPSVSPHPTNCITGDVFFSQNGPFPTYLKRFHSDDTDSDYCSCGGMARHFTMPRSVFAQCLGI